MADHQRVEGAGSRAAGCEAAALVGDRWRSAPAIGADRLGKREACRRSRTRWVEVFQSSCVAWPVADEKPGLLKSYCRISRAHAFTA